MQLTLLNHPRILHELYDLKVPKGTCRALYGCPQPEPKAENMAASSSQPRANLATSSQPSLPTVHSGCAVLDLRCTVVLLALRVRCKGSANDNASRVRRARCLWTVSNVQKLQQQGRLCRPWGRVIG